MVFYFLTNLLLFCFQANVWLYKKIRWITFFILFIFFELCNITWIYFTPLEALKHPWKAMISKRHFWQNLSGKSLHLLPSLLLFYFYSPLPLSRLLNDSGVMMGACLSYICLVSARQHVMTGAVQWSEYVNCSL